MDRQCAVGPENHPTTLLAQPIEAYAVQSKHTHDPKYIRALEARGYLSSTWADKGREGLARMTLGP